MLSINTNLSSLIAQNSMKSSSFKLDTAIERMTTGYKINHASDNAANYSIATNMQTQIGSYNIAADNVAMGMDLVTTASDTVSLMQDKAQRLRALCTQARNGTFGAQSLAAINTEANAIVAEIDRIYSTAQYNGVSLFTGGTEIVEATPAVATFALPRATTTTTGQFIENPVTYTEAEIEAMLASGDIVALDNNVTDFTSGKKYLISDETQLVRLATLVNSGKGGSGATFILGADIDLGAHCDAELANGNGGWTPIGNSTKGFYGTFDGNGHVIENLKIDRDEKYQGLFGNTGNSEIKNVGLEGGSVKGQAFVGGLVGYSTSSTISNSYATCNITGSANSVGGLVGVFESGISASCSISNSYATGTVSGTENVGGLVGSFSQISSSCSVSISNSHATGVVSGNKYIGGLVGKSRELSSNLISNSYATGDVIGSGDYVGGLVGSSGSSISNSYATGTVTGSRIVGGLVGGAYRSISNSYATGYVTGTKEIAGGLVGQTSGSLCSISNSYATGDVTIEQGRSYIGGLVGYSNSSGSISNCYATGNITGKFNYAGGLVGYSFSTTISNSYATGDVTNTGYSYAGGLAGSIGASSSISNSYATGIVAGSEYVGGLVGSASGSIANSYATGTVTGSNNVSGLVGSGSGTVTDSAAVQTDPKATVMTVEQIKSTYTYDSMGFTDANGWKIVNDQPYFIWQNVPVAPTPGGGSSSGGSYGVSAFNLQIGTYSDSSCQIGFDVNFTYDLSPIGIDIASDDALATIDSFIAQLSEHETTLGAVQNRLESALESISVNIENLTSSLSTIRDADIAEVSSQYIQQQILQQAAATLMSTANQSPAIALQLI